jgi:tetratricopeptide (TPR) repeat protein
LAVNPDIGGWPERIVLAGTSVLFYLGKCVAPVAMMPIYPKWPIGLDSPLALAPLAVLALLAWIWSRRKSWGRHALLGVGFFLINLLPFLGLNSVSYMGFTWVMDHFVYLPMIGLIGLAVAGLESLCARFSPGRAPLQIGAAAVISLLALESHLYADAFDGPEKLWSYTVAHNPGSWLAHNNLGAVYLQTGRPAQAIREYQAALAANPGSVEAHTNLGFAFEQQHDDAGAQAQYALALQGNPHFSTANANLGHLLERTGHPHEAIPHYEAALQADPTDQGTRQALDRLRKNPE